MKKVPAFSINIILLPLFYVLFIWGAFWCDWTYFLELYEYGVYPRTWSGLRGIFFSPFIHGGLKHLYNNSGALFILLIILQYFYKRQTWKVVVLGILLSGFGTWLFARPSYHIGASGLVYVLVSFIFFKGMQTRYYRLMAVSLVIVVLYGGTVWYMFPSVEEGISWEGHLSGFIAGLILSYVIEEPEIPEKYYKYDWQKPSYDASQDPFMQCFDENGNFIVIPKEKPIDYSNCYRPTLPIVYVDYLQKYREYK
ncbi:MULTISPECIES: rhomboid family intramembrane serine protease [Myroides]|uniref:Rhomboid family intramembrane serine protease n=1 Tax=Myroides albus TaxID=2562892 RepID=A0A6I3LJF8_9FLAO|nr:MULTISPECIES: rhomboid family intramembrane serine protease [Myroides]MTG97330.1 rhomboid family intramembrane serine protease [Myroides albus]MVX34300.1 rhomboid family intramembrane serine protease [Myroides sp. LoEW2-1]UVD80584.1 rhomboid family intramembrane serine protease [Myroides albus]